MKDIDIIYEQIKAVCPNVQMEQLKVTHPADDDGIWFITTSDFSGTIQIESPTGNCPFHIEADFTDKRIQAPTIGQAVDDLIELIRTYSKISSS